MEPTPPTAEGRRFNPPKAQRAPTQSVALPMNTCLQHAAAALLHQYN